MKSRPSIKHLGLLALAVATLGTASAHADESSCPLESGPRTVMPHPGAMGPKMNTTFVYTQELHEQMSRIEQALREGRISPYEAGFLTRQAWELARFKQGFQAGMAPSSSRGCGLSPELAAQLAPLGELAKNGMQTAGSLMRALMRETERMLKEEPPEQAPL